MKEKERVIEAFRAMRSLKGGPLDSIKARRELVEAQEDLDRALARAQKGVSNGRR